ncbi:hypothetical protein P3G55_18805 [Leptospira sp. 96542]|nr:hypothetical protein [Leptospira sp. 96542]
MKVLGCLETQVSQAEFAQMIGVSEARVSQLVGENWIVRGDTAHEWLLSYCERLRDVAAGRASAEGGGLDLVQERAALARAQREGVEIKNSVARGEYAPIKLLAEVLADASQAVVERFEQLPSQLRKTCPDITPAAVEQVLATIASARNEWVRATAELVAKSLEEADDDTLELPLEGEA